MMADLDTHDWADVAKVLPDEVELIGRMQREDPVAYQRLADAVSATGARIDRFTRTDVELRHQELGDGKAFRVAWVALFGKPRIRPAAQIQLAVHVLDSAGMESGRDIALFLSHVDLLQATVVGGDEDSRQASLLALDNEVYNARQALRRLREAERAEDPEDAGEYTQRLDEARRNPSSLIRTIEWVTCSGLRRLATPSAGTSPVVDP